MSRRKKRMPLHALYGWRWTEHATTWGNVPVYRIASEGAD